MGRGEARRSGRKIRRDVSPAALRCGSATGLVKSVQLPVPYRVAFCVPVPALSLTFNVPVYVTVVTGEKLIATLHDAPGANVVA
jgi:hypothetical protein